MVLSFIAVTVATPYLPISENLPVLFTSGTPRIHSVLRRVYSSWINMKLRRAFEEDWMSSKLYPLIIFSSFLVIMAVSFGLSLHMRVSLPSKSFSGSINILSKTSLWTILVAFSESGYFSSIALSVIILLIIPRSGEKLTLSKEFPIIFLYISDSIGLSSCRMKSPKISIMFRLK